MGTLVFGRSVSSQGLDTFSIIMYIWWIFILFVFVLLFECFVLISVCSKDMKSSKPIENVFYYWKCLSQYEMIKNVLYILTVKCSPNYCNTSWYGCVVNLDYLDVFHLHSLHCRPLATKLSDMSLAAFQDICTITNIWI